MSRNKKNLVIFAISYIVNNLISGVLYDTYINYLQEVNVEVATSFWAFYGYATFISAILLLIIPFFGYKKLLVSCNLFAGLSLLSIIVFKNPTIYYIATLLSLTGVQLHYVLLAPYISIYTNEENKIKWYTRAWYFGYIGYFFSTFLGGMITVKLFSINANITFEKAKELTSYLESLSPVFKQQYLNANVQFLLIVGIIALIGIIPSLFVEEHKEDYTVEVKEVIDLPTKIKNIIQATLNKNALLYLAYWSLVSFGMGLFVPYLTVYLNRNLHIDKATSSSLVSLSYLAIAIFLLFTPYTVKKIGQVSTLGLLFIFSIPFMLIIANGEMFGKYMIIVVGIALFFRAGLANLGSPIDSSLSMDIVPVNLRPAYASVVSFVSSFASIASGHFTGSYLFKTHSGYYYAFYIAALLYLISCFILIIGLKKFNKKELDN